MRAHVRSLADLVGSDGCLTAYARRIAPEKRRKLDAHTELTLSPGKPCPMNSQPLLFLRVMRGGAGVTPEPLRYQQIRQQRESAGASRRL